jgi:hypothetical protein
VNLVGWIGFTFLGFWLAIAAICQIPGGLERWLRRCDVAGVIPHWSFFAPQPGVWNYHLVYRDQLADGAITRWTEVDIIDARTPWHSLWNPRRRMKKAFHDLVTQLMRESTTQPIDGLPLSISYIMLLTFVSSLPRSIGTQGTQFAIVMGYGGTSAESPVPAFVSALHPL